MDIMSMVWKLGTLMTKFIKLMGAISAFLAVVGFAIYQLLDVELMLDEVTAGFDAATALIQTQVFNHYMEMLNAIFPLGELMGFLALYFPLYVICMVIRWAKSWVPTMN